MAGDFNRLTLRECSPVEMLSFSTGFLSFLLLLGEGQLPHSHSHSL